MKLFARLYQELDESNRTTDKVTALEKYFREAPARDAVWALYILTGNRLKRPLNSTQLRDFVAQESGLPLWLIEECYSTVGDFSETVSLLLGEGPGTERPFHAIIEEELLPMVDLDDEQKRQRLRLLWSEFTSWERFVWQKLMSGAFRVGVSRTLVTRALAKVADVSPSEMAHRVMGKWEPTEEDFQRIISGESERIDITRPYPFCLATPIEESPESLGDLSDWLVEWKWDGIRAQLIVRDGQVLIWSRGEELITDRFPEITSIASRIANGTVLDGEILCWQNDAPMPFQVLQQRIGRKSLTKKVLTEAPVIFLAYDLMERYGEDLREAPLSQRRELLRETIQAIDHRTIRLSDSITEEGWESLAAVRESSRERGVEGMMLKRLTSPYRVGRVRGDWWKWKVDPFHIDAVLVYAQSGSGRRASLYTDYTFAVWKDGDLVPIAKAYSGLSDEEIRKVDAWIRRNTLDRHGPVRVVKPELVFELAFEGIQPSSRHKSGIAVRFPRISRWRTDKKATEADSIEALRALLQSA